MSFRGWSRYLSSGVLTLHYVTDREQIVDILRQPEVFASSVVIGDAVRKRLHRLLAPRALARFEPVLRTQAAALVESVAAQRSCEVIADVALPFAVSSMLTILGLPPTEYNQMLGLAYRSLLSDWGSDAQTTEDQIRVRYLARALKQSPPQGIRAELLAGEEALTDAQLLAVCDVVLANGMISTAAAIGSVLHRLAGNWGTCQGLRLAPQLIKPFVEKVLREDPPVAEVPRTALRAVTLPDGVTLEAGTEFGLNLREANRSPGASLTFSAGAHRCIGQHLARLEIAVLLSEWLRIIGDFELAVPRSDLYVARTVPGYVLESLPLQWNIVGKGAIST